ncbi:hypothetical protein M408DRAFT_333001 [Serendipita vermifera MAFF 305830]|uniref:Uncharacterized protein n=1 Tax=Serendipita vermifera MAFF 305830 TaxID=933852 RepID=A0A0C2W709_SERVB|nr:hypothetical protein M408DRAFT_333001 [Serendipita vermifera MAFF 305830]
MVDRSIFWGVWTQAEFNTEEEKLSKGSWTTTGNKENVWGGGEDPIGNGKELRSTSEKGVKLGRKATGVKRMEGF